LKILKPLARRWNGRISTVYDTIRGVKARLDTKNNSNQQNLAHHLKHGHPLVCCIEQEDESDHRMCRCRVLGLHELLHANSLEREEEKHASGGCQEEETTAKLVAQESG